ncbi:hypothetical protein ABTM31_20955, partial [Acinetobacter baumannii]
SHILMNHVFRPRKSDGGNNQGGGNNQNRRRRNTQRHTPRDIDPSELENLPQVDYNTFDQMSTAELAKAAKKAKISLDTDRGVV